MDAQPTSAAFGDAWAALRPQTLAMQEIIELSKKIEIATGQAFALNLTDLVALLQLMLRGPLTPTELARGLRLTSAAVTTVVDRLESAGHVTRSQHPTDGRGVLVVATEASVERAMRTLMPMATSIDGALDDFDEEECAVITRYLESVAARHREALQ